MSLHAYYNILDAAAKFQQVYQPYANSIGYNVHVIVTPMPVQPTVTSVPSTQTQNIPPPPSDDEETEEEEPIGHPKLSTLTIEQLRTHNSLHNQTKECVSSCEHHTKYALTQAEKTRYVTHWYNVLVGETCIFMYEICTKDYILVVPSSSTLVSPFCTDNVGNTNRYVKTHCNNGRDYCISTVYRERAMKATILSPLGLQRIIDREVKIYDSDYAKALRNDVMPYCNIYKRK